jgi:hypothetical protein
VTKSLGDGFLTDFPFLCVGRDKNIAAIAQLHLASKHAKKEEEEGSREHYKPQKG